MANEKKSADVKATAPVKSIETKTDATATAPAPVVVESTSEELTKLLTEKAGYGKTLATAAAGSKEQEDSIQAILLVNNKIAAEKANIAKLAKQAELDEMKSKRVQVLMDAIFADRLNIATPNDENDKRAKDALDAAKNALLSGMPRTATVATTGDKKTGTPGAKGQTTAAIRAEIAPMYEGVTRDTVGEVGKKVRAHVIKELNFNDGTANAAILTYEIEIGLKDAK